MKKIIFLVLVCYTSSLFAQKLAVLKDKTLSSAPGKDLKYCNQYGIKNIYKGDAINGGGEKMGFADLGEAGFVFRNETKLSFYTNDIELKWEKEFGLVNNYMNRGYIDMIGTEGIGYLLEIGTKKINIVKFKADGTISEKLIDLKEIEDICEKSYTSVYGYSASNNKLYLLVGKFLTKEKEQTYHLVEFDEKLDRKIVRVELPHTPEELEILGAGLNSKYFNGTFYMSSGPSSKNSSSMSSKSIIRWELKTQSESKIYFLKKYTIEDEKDRGNAILNIDICTFDKNTSKLDIQAIKLPELKYKENGYINPELKFDLNSRVFYLFGAISNGVKGGVVNGFYLLKYTLDDGKIVSNYSYLYSELVELMKGDTKLSDKVSSSIIAESVYFILGDLDVESGNFNIGLQGITTGIKSITNHVRISNTGEILRIDESYYLNSHVTFGDYKLWPAESSTKYKATNCPDSVLDLIYTNVGKVEPSYLLSKIYVRKDYYTVVYINDKDSELRAFKVKID